MRKIARTDRERGNALANDSGKQILLDFSSLTNLHLKLLIPKEKVFDGKGNPIYDRANIPFDTLTPILLLYRKDNEYNQEAL